MPGDFTPQALWPCRFNCDVSTASPTVTGLAVQFATDVLWALSGRQFGFTTVTLRPVQWHQRDTPFPDLWIAWPGAMAPPMSASPFGTWWGWAIDEIDMGFCSNVEARLPAPVYDVTQVKVDGQILPTTSYRVDDNRILVRTDGNAWPAWNDLRKDDTQNGTWSATGVFGSNIPADAALAVGELACEFLRAIDGEDCRLPKNITSIARQGVTIRLPDPAEAFKSGLTGLRLPDLFIKTWNPKGLRSRARSYSVDTHLLRRTGTSP
jgi:hypothetical protein